MASYENSLKKKSKREPVSKSQRNEVLARQKNRCARCKKPLDMRDVKIDHIKEVNRGGKSKVANLQALCGRCHSIKTHEERLKKVEKRRKTNSSKTLTEKKERTPLWKQIP